MKAIGVITVALLSTAVLDPVTRRPSCGVITTNHSWRGGGVVIKALTDGLSQMTGREVLDRTGLTHHSTSISNGRNQTTRLAPHCSLRCRKSSA